MEALELFGKDWKKVQAFVGTRTTTQARSHAQKYFAKKDKNNLGELLVEDNGDSSCSQSQAPTAVNSPACKPAPEAHQTRSSVKSEGKHSSSPVVKSVKRKLAYQEEPAVNKICKVRVVLDDEDKKLNSENVKKLNVVANKKPDSIEPNSGDVVVQHEEQLINWLNEEGCYSAQSYPINSEPVSEYNPNYRFAQQFPEPHANEYNVEFELEDLQLTPNDILELPPATLPLTSERLFSDYIAEPLFSADFSDIPDLLNTIPKAYISA